MSKIGLFYGSNGGVTQSVAELIGKQIAGEGFDVSVIDIADAVVGDFANYSSLIFGTSTWGMGDLQDDWDGFIDELDGTDFSGKKIALFGIGDQEGYPDTFVDGMGIIFNKIKNSGADLIGKFNDDDIVFDESVAFDGENFVGLVIDEDNQSDRTDERIKSWVMDVKKHLDVA